MKLRPQACATIWNTPPGILPTNSARAPSFMRTGTTSWENSIQRSDAMRSLCGKAADAAQSWGNSAAKDAAAANKTLLSSSNRRQC